MDDSPTPEQEEKALKKAMAANGYEEPVPKTGMMYVAPGLIYGYVLETDDFTVGGLSGEMAFDVLLGATHTERKVVRYCINIHKYRDDITKAINTVTLMGIPVERITIIEGEVQAHPPAQFHWRCPFCYPNNVGSQEHP